MPDNAKHFDMSLFPRALAPMPYAQIGNVVILLTAIETAELADDGSLMLCFISGQEMTLSPDQTADLFKVMDEGYRRALSAQAANNARQLGIISRPQ